MVHFDKNVRFHADRNKKQVRAPEAFWDHQDRSGRQSNTTHPEKTNNKQTNKREYIQQMNLSHKHFIKMSILIVIYFTKLQCKVKVGLGGPRGLWVVFIHESPPQLLCYRKAL